MKPASPDEAEERFADQNDEAIPTRGYQLLRTVGLGGSAGSIPALKQLFETMPLDTGMAFVVIVHLSPEHESVLAQMLQRSTRMPVLQVTDNVRVEPNHVYVIPPRKALSATGDELHLADLLPNRGQHVAVDLFFRTLADTYGPHAVAVVLSGADSDGAIGIRRIKERGGLTIAQDPEQAEHDGMPRSAIATGMIDWVLPIEDIGDKLREFERMEGALSLPADVVPRVDREGFDGAAEHAIAELLTLLRMTTGHDFGRLGRTNMMRRIARRMQIKRIVDVPGYLDCLRAEAGEIRELRKDLLASLSNFFRDSHAFEALEAGLDALFEDRGAVNAVRVWVPACATGEEAYSIAMLLVEHCQRRPDPPLIQVFATDVDEESIKSAREGVYPATIRADVSDERLERFFTPDARGFRVRRELRELVLFAVHDVLIDPPIARLDLVSCRNLLISLSAHARQMAAQVFHFALRLDGRLFLGVSETLPEGNPYFDVLDETHRIYRKRATQQQTLPPSVDLSAPARQAVRAALEPLLVSAALAPTTARAPAPSWRRGGGSTAAPSEVHYQLIERFAAPSVLVDADHEILHMSQRAGRFLTMAGGEPSRNLLQLVHPMLRADLRAALARAQSTGEGAEVWDIPVEDGGQPHSIGIGVTPAQDILPGAHLVTFIETSEADAQRSGADARSDAAELRSVELDRELDRLRSHLGKTIEQNEATIEELKASNEELQAMNEELYAATEELETSREELQSINEELSTVNAELKSRVEEVRSTNSDLHNLMSAIAVPTVFLDASLHVTLFTPSAVSLFNFIAADVGRPFTDLSKRLVYPELEEHARQVLKTLVPAEREVRDLDGRWYLSRIQPYRTLDDHIAGVVLTLAEISGQKTAQGALLESRGRLQAQLRLFRTMLAALPDNLYTLDRERRFVYANPAAERHFGRSVEQMVGRRLEDAGCEPGLAARLEVAIQTALATARPASGVEEGVCGAGPFARFRYSFSPVNGLDGVPETVIGWFRECEAAAPAAAAPTPG